MSKTENHLERTNGNSNADSLSASSVQMHRLIYKTVLTCNGSKEMCHDNHLLNGDYGLSIEGKEKLFNQFSILCKGNTSHPEHIIEFFGARLSGLVVTRRSSTGVEFAIVDDFKLKVAQLSKEIFDQPPASPTAPPTSENTEPLFGPSV